MKLLWLLVFIPLVTFASEVFLTEVDIPYEVIPFTTNVTESQVHLGTLEDFPVMYEFSVATTTEFVAQLSQFATGNITSNPLAIMLVQRDTVGGGVTEIIRQNPADDAWRLYKDSVVGVSFWRAEPVVVDLEPGTYRIEVSSPDNLGKYLLQIGPEEDGGYFSDLARAWKIQQFAEFSPLRILTSSLVYYPLGILMLGFLINRTWKYRKLITNGT
jgi:hypothetical protein